jgi:hypothetical protein
MSPFILLLVGSLCAFSLLARADEYELAPRLFVSKSFEAPVVVNGNFAIKYLIINNGDAKAKDINIEDKYDPNLFEGLKNVDKAGTVVFELDELDVGDQIEQSVIISPKLHGIYESTRARVKYSSGALTPSSEEDGEDEDEEDAEDEPMVGFSTSIGRVRILSVEEHLRTSKAHVLEWTVFFFSVAAAVVIPWNTWRGARKVNAK